MLEKRNLREDAELESPIKKKLSWLFRIDFALFS